MCYITVSHVPCGSYDLVINLVHVVYSLPAYNITIIVPMYIVTEVMYSYTLSSNISPLAYGPVSQLVHFL